MGERLEARSYDIKESVFNGDTEAIMYVIEDIYNESFIVSIPVITFSMSIYDKYDYKYLFQDNTLGNKDKQKNLIHAIKQAISDFK